MPLYNRSNKRSHLSLPDERVNRSRGAELEAFLDDGLAAVGHQHYGYAVQHSGAGHNRQDDEPEPEEDVDLLVEDVERQYAERVQLLYRSGGTVFVEGALGHAREHLDHRVGTLLLIHVAEREHLRAVCEESSAQEEVDEEYVTDLKQKESNINFVQRVRRRFPYSSMIKIIYSPVMMTLEM